MFDCFLKDHIEAMVSGPTRPIYIVNIIINSLIGLKSGVIPVDSPTVPNPDTTSKNSCMKVYSGSRMVNKKVFTQTSAIARKVSTNAFDMISLGSFLLKQEQFRPVDIL